jgi:type 1 glutamine amidotransferase
MSATMLRPTCRLACLFLLGFLGAAIGRPAVAAAADDEQGFEPMFDGKNLDGWDGNPKFWRVEDGTITGQTTADNPTRGNTFCIYRKAPFGDFEIRLEYRMVGGNSGVQYRSWEEPGPANKWVMGGYQADMDAGNGYTGIIYGERFRGILVGRGQKTVIGDDHKPKVAETFANGDELKKVIKKEDWNQYRIVAQGFHFTQYINGQKMSEVVDEDQQARRASGLIGLQLHAGPPMKVQFRNIRIKKLSADDKPGEGRKAEGKQGAKKIALIAGGPSHGYGSHTHYAGCVLLARWLGALPGVECKVYRNRWPKDPSVLEDANTIVVFSDGGGGHPIIPHLDEVAKLMRKGVGLAMLHYAVEVPKGKPGDCLLAWTGGYFETFWSVNPHWRAEFEKFPDHPVARGLKPFAIDDEWYYHMRFPEEMKGFTPILSAVPPERTRTGPDGPRSGNPAVRSRKGMAEHLAWVTERSDGGRGFGFTGGHWHWNWANPGFRTAVLNGIAWTAGIEIPAGGIPSKTPTMDELEANADYAKPQGFDGRRWAKQIEDWNKE